MSTLETLSDAALFTQCQAGSQPAWNVMVRRFQRLVYTVPRRAGLSEAQSADVFQVAFSRLFENIDRIDDPSRVRAWLVTTAKRETLRLLEQAKRQGLPGLSGTEFGESDSDDDTGNDPLEHIADPSPLPETLLSDLQEQDRLHRALAQLDERARALLTLLFLQEEPLSYSEIARRMQMPEGSIGPTRARCLDRLRALLEKI